MAQQPPMGNAFPELGGNWQNVQLDKPAGGNAGYPSPSHAPMPDQSGEKLVRQGSWYKMDLESADPFVALVVIVGCSFVIMCQAAVECGGEWSEGCQNEYAYAVAVGVLSFIVGLLVIGWSYCAEDLFNQFSPVVAIFFLVWWGFGTAVTTFKAPFADSGNGYFASWGAFIASFIMAGAVSERLRKFLGKAVTRVVAESIEAKLSMGVAAASIVLLVAVAIQAADYTEPSGQELWGVICAVVSFLLVFVHTILRICCEGITLPPWLFGGLLTIWWLGGVAVLTFDEPFKNSGNGYFACWVGFILSFWLALEGLDGYGGLGFSNRNKSSSNKPGIDQAAANMGMAPSQQQPYPPNIPPPL